MHTKKLFSEGLIEQSDPSGATKKWIGKAIAGMIIADRIIRPSEKIFVRILRDEFNQDPEEVYEIHKILRTKNLSELKSIEMDRKLAEKVLRSLLEIATVDKEVQVAETNYIRKVAQLIKLDQAWVQKKIQGAIEQTKIDYFHDLAKELDQEESYWLAVIILKVIKADAQIDQEEIAYLNDIYILLQGDRATMNSIRQNVDTIDVKSLPKVFFDDVMTLKILRYLIELTYRDQNIDHRELGLIHDIAHSMGVSKLRLEKLVKSIQATYALKQNQS